MDTILQGVALKHKNDPMTDIEIQEQILLRKRLISAMLGTLYPNILSSEIDFLYKRLQRLDNLNA